MKKDSIGNRMKDNYENRSRYKLTRRTPVIIRLDGKAFHTLTRGCEKPFDEHLQSTMEDTAWELCAEIQGAKLAYVQSDEISILLTDFDTLTTQAWFDYNLQKIVSISAAIASVSFSNNYFDESEKGVALFDSRAFNIPVDEVCNYFVWRQQDWYRNSLQMLAQSHFSHKQLQNKNTPQMHEMLHEIGVNWANLANWWKNGVLLYKGEGRWNTSYGFQFSKDRDVVEQYLEAGDE